MPLIPARRGERLTFATLLGLVVLLAVVPIARLAQEALAPHGRFDAGVLASVVESPVGVNIPAGTPHSQRIIEGAGHFFNFVPKSFYNDGLMS